MIVRALRLPIRVWSRRAAMAAAVVLGGCGRGEVSVAESSTRGASAAVMNDLLAIRVPLQGGAARVHIYHRPDSIIWRSQGNAPAVARILGFDDEGGSLAYVDAKGALVRIDLRSGRVASVTKPELKGLTSSDGSTIYGLAADGVVHRVTPTARWTFRHASGVRELFPQPDGSLLISADKGDSTRLFRMRPPESVLIDTTAIPRALRSASTRVGDRVYFATSEGLIAVRSRDLRPNPPIELEQRPRVIAPTPSGDRLYVLTDSSEELIVVDRYKERVDHRIRLPAVSTDLRMDPLGRYVLARSSTSDSAWVVAVGTDRVIGTVASVWRSDLPAIAADGTLITARGKDVVVVDPETRRAVRTIRGGAADFWHLFIWSGFRPRAEGLDEPVTFASSDTTADDSSFIAPPPGPDTGGFAPTVADTAAKPASAGFTVSFATLLQEDAARALAPTIRSGNTTARVVSSNREGTMIYRVVLGPYPTRDAADRVGRATGKPYWVFEGAP